MLITEITPQKKIEHKLLRLAAYCRVSSDSQDQLNSFAAQIRYYSDYTRKHPEYQLVDIYADEGITGTAMKKRDEMNRLLRDCKKGLIDVIIVKSISRFARNTEELLVTLRMLNEIGVSVFFEEQGIDSSKLNMEMIVTFPGMAAQQESVAISGNLRWSYQKRMESGEFNTTNPAYGYDLENGVLVYDEDEMLVVRRIFEMYLQGNGIQTIARILNEECIPRRYKNQRRWYPFTVRYILLNERYMGDAVLQKQYTTDTLPFRLKNNRGEKPKYYVENSNIPLVSRETFEAVQSLMLTRRVHQTRTEHFLTGKIRCPECGWAFRRQEIRCKYYWHCAGRSAGVKDCQSRRVREDMVIDTFINMMWKLHDNSKELLGDFITHVEMLQTRTSVNTGRIKEIDKELADLGAKNLVLARLHTSGILSSADYSAQSADLSRKITELRLERRKKIDQDEIHGVLDEVQDLRGIVEEYIPSLEFDVDLFNQIVERIVVDNNTQITFTLIGGIQLTEQIDEKGRCKSA